MDKEKTDGKTKRCIYPRFDNSFCISFDRLLWNMGNEDFFVVVLKLFVTSINHKQQPLSIQDFHLVVEY